MATGVLLSALCAPATVIALAIILNLRISWEFIVLVTLLPIIIYLFDYFDDEGVNEFRKRSWVAGSLLALILIGLYITIRYSNIAALFFYIMLLFLGIFYPLFFKRLTRKIVGFKDIFVAINWNLVIIFYFVFFGIGLTKELLFFLVFIFIRDLINVNYCDLKDIHQDKDKGLKTFTLYLGKNKMLTLLNSGNLVSILFLILAWNFQLIPELSLFLLIPIAVVSALILYSSFRQQYPSYFVDIEYPLWLAVIAFSRIMS